MVEPFLSAESVAEIAVGFLEEDSPYLLLIPAKLAPNVASIATRNSFYCIPTLCSLLLTVAQIR